MNEKQKAQLKEEFKEYFPFSVSIGGEHNFNYYADFWLSKLDILLKEQREELIEKIKKSYDLVPGHSPCRDRVINLIKSNNE